MKAVVFTEHPGIGRAFVRSFKNEEEVDSYRERNECMVFNFDELDDEITRLRKWMKSAYAEFALAKSRMMHAQRMLDQLYEYDEEVAS
jgi:hypothetical protein